MKAKQSYAEYLKDWKNLLGQIASDASLTGVPAAQRHTTLATLVTGIEGLLQKQAEQDAVKQSTTEELRGMVKQGRELARDIKLELRGRLGARAVELVKYKVAPLRKRRSRAAEPESPLPEPTAPAASPVSSG